MDRVGNTAPTISHPEVATAVHLVSLGEGLYSLAVRPAASRASPSADLALPALHISEAPSSTTSGRLELLPGPNLVGNWLTQPGDAIVARVSGGACQVLIMSLTRQGIAPLAIEVRRLDQPVGTVSPASSATEIASQPTTSILQGSNMPAPALPSVKTDLEPIFDNGIRVLRTSVAAHVQNRGDVRHDGEGWAGAFDDKLCVEAYALAVMEEFEPGAITYKAITASGFETPWLSKGAWCGTRGMGIPLVGIAVRLQPEIAERFQCDYSAAFRSGLIGETVSDGVMSRSTEKDDPVIAIRLRVVERTTSIDSGTVSTPVIPASAESIVISTGDEAVAAIEEVAEPVTRAVRKHR